MLVPSLLAVTILLPAVSLTDFDIRGSFIKSPSEHRFNYFDVELLQALSNVQKGNIVASPLSVKTVLSMVYDGAGGKTAQELQQSLRLPENKFVMHQRTKSILSSLKIKNPGYTVETANQIFVSAKTYPLQEYTASLRKNYFAELQQLDFSSPTAATKINQWVSTETHGLIPQLLESVPPDAKMVLANAVYFKGKWKQMFDKNATVIRCFNLENGDCYKANFMETNGLFKYAYIDSLDAQVVEVPYEGNRFSMLLFLPVYKDGIQQLIRDLPFTSLHNIVNSLMITEMNLSVPRFQIEYQADLVQYLKNLGINEMFTPQANLSRMFEDPSYVSMFLHKAKIVVNEEGSEAAAATAAVVVPLILSVVPTLRLDRPFIYFIRDSDTGGVLFSGKVSTPEPASKDSGNIPEPPSIPNRPQYVQETNPEPPSIPNRPQYVQESNPEPPSVPNRPQYVQESNPAPHYQKPPVRYKETILYTN